ncbi:hypothetical protein [Microbacterium sp. ZW T5_56]|uniref:hypothetical protein n=1 Tax=Microbacterium sp. ZW T5_56 TaxID=3378081 RepID=UPI0038545502
MRSRFIALGGLLVAITGLTGCSPAVVGAIALTGYDLRERTLSVMLVVCEGYIDELLVFEPQIFATPSASVSARPGERDDFSLGIHTAGISRLTVDDVDLSDAGGGFNVSGYGGNGSLFFPYDARTPLIENVMMSQLASLAPGEVLSGESPYGGNVTVMTEEAFEATACE